MKNRMLFSGSIISLVFCSVSIRGAVFTVANGDVAGFIAAVNAANSTVAADTISLAFDGDYSFTAYQPTANPLDRTALPHISSSITIEGNGSVIRRALSIGFSIPEFRLLRVSASGDLTLRNATVRNGDLWNPEDHADDQGSGLRNDGGVLTIEGCRFDNNQNTHWASAIHTTGPTVITETKFIENTSLDGGTGAIRAFDTTTLLLERCQFTKNTGDETIRVSNVDNAEISQCSVVKAGGGGINQGWGIRAFDTELRISNCTITDGSSIGVKVETGATVTVTHCTITEHGQANRPGRGVQVDGGTLNLRNSIVAGNYNGPSGFNQDCDVNSGTLAQNQSNLIQDGSCNPDFIGDPKLGELGFHAKGGKTKVYPLIEGSPAIDNASARISEPIDQRGVARPVGPLPDIGAYEGSVPDRTPWTRFVVDLLYRAEPYIIICDPLGEEIIDVAIQGTREVPVRTILPATLTLGNSPAGSARVVGARDVNRDGLDDLVVTFQQSEVYRGASSCDAVTLLELQGFTRQGQPIAGYVNVVAGEIRR